MKSLSRQSLLATAHHEAGHAVAAFVMNLPVNRISIFRFGGSVLHHSSFYRTIDPESMKHTRPLQFRDRVERNVIVALAGAEAQRRFSPRSWRRHHSEVDLHNAIAMLSHVAEEEEELKAHFALLRIRTQNLINIRWTAVTALANALVDRSKVFSGGKQGWTMTGKEARQVVLDHLRRP